MPLSRNGGKTAGSIVLTPTDPLGSTILPWPLSLDGGCLVLLFLALRGPGRAMYACLEDEAMMMVPGGDAPPLTNG